MCRAGLYAFDCGGGIRTAADVRRMLNAGADKVSFNTAAIHNPDLLDECSSSFGSQCTVLAIDARRKVDGGWQVFTHGGRNPTELDAVQWAVEGTRRGAGEILLTSMDADGTKEGFDVELTRTISEAVPVPVIASGGAGTLKHMAEAVTRGEGRCCTRRLYFSFWRIYSRANKRVYAGKRH